MEPAAARYWSLTADINGLAGLIVFGGALSARLAIRFVKFPSEQ